MPGGLGTAVVLTFVAGGAAGCGGKPTVVPEGATGNVEPACTTSGPSPWLIALAIFVWAAPIVSTAYLAWRSSTRPEPARPLGAAIPSP